MTELVLRSDRVVTPQGVHRADVVVQSGTIAAVEFPLRGRRVTDLGDRWLLPGFIDVHVHGGGGAQCNTADPEEIARVARFHAGHGTTALLATTVAAPVDELVAAMDAVRAAAASPQPGGADILGAHLEGPFLNAARPGAMDPAHFAKPDAATCERLLSTGAVRVMTVAPELPGGLELVRALVAAGVVASMGHSSATAAEAAAAVTAGARALTHAFNAMPPLHHREPGVLGASLNLDAVTCELICDGVHVDPLAARLLLRLKGPGGTMLVSDAIEAAGMPDGSYRLGDRAIAVSGVRATLPGTGTLAGSLLTMDAAVRNAVVRCGATVEAAARMAATTPAELLGIGERKGALAEGRDADLVVLDDDLAVVSVMVRGEWR